MKKRMRILVAGLLLIGLVGTSVYADTPKKKKKPSDTTAATTASTEETTFPEFNSTTEEKTEKKTGKKDKTEATDKKKKDKTETTEKGTGDGSDTSTENGSTEQPSNSPYYSGAQIAALRAQYSQSVLEKQEVQRKLNDMKRKQNDFIENLQEMDNEIIRIQDQIDEMQEQRKKVDATITQLKYELEFAEQDVQSQYAKLKVHIQNSYENGNFSYMDALLQAVNFSDVLNKTEYVEQVSKYDEVLLTDYIGARQKLANRLKMLETMTEDFGIMEVYYQDRQDALVLLSDEKEKQITAYQNEIDDQQAELTKLEVQEQIQANQIASIEQAAHTLINYDPITYPGGVFVWPQPSSTHITSDYGWRGDIGIPGASKDHKGIDIKANMYDPVVAAAAGTVIYTGYYGTGGKTVMIDVGSDITIIYHHLNDYAVTQGDSVTAGQVVGHVGMTGVTGGPHLHFSVRVKGTYVNPRPYLGI